MGGYIGEYCRIYEGDTRSLDYSSSGSCSKGPCKEGTNGNTLPQKGILTKQRTYIMAFFGTGILNNYHVSYCQR